MPKKHEIADRVIGRYFRRFTKNKTVGIYNEVVETVCKRIYSTYHKYGEHLKAVGPYEEPMVKVGSENREDEDFYINETNYRNRV